MAKSQVARRFAKKHVIPVINFKLKKRKPSDGAGMLRFTDGVNINTSGEYRVIHLKDGYYVVGKGLCCPVDSQLDGDRTIAELKASS